MKNTLSLLLLLLCAHTVFSTPKNLPQAVSCDTERQAFGCTRPNEAWQVAATNSIEQLEYGFRAISGGFIVANDKNGFHGVINNDGYLLAPTHEKTERLSWNTNITLESIGGNLHAMQKGLACQHAGTTLTYRYKPYDIIYQNAPSGLRQNFLIKEKPVTEDMLCVRMRIISTLYPRLTNGHLIFTEDKESKNVAFAYDDLHVWDATGKKLPAYFILSGDMLSIITDDAGAEYPITVDPLNHTPEWASSASGLLSSLSQTQINSSLYGYAVASAGDVNGDGYDDVAVGAPGVADIFSGTGTLASVGAVFIFHGSATGLSTVPSNVLQPSSAVAGALFGYSIDGAEATGDGLSDLLVGAPLDDAIINIGGSTTITSTVGKAYFYSGSSLTTSNPGTYVSVTLDGSLVSSINTSNKPLFGFSVAFADDLTGDGKREFIVGAPAYAGATLFAIGPKTGAAFVYNSDASNTFSSFTTLTAPSFTTLGILGAGGGLIQGLLFGYSVDGIGDYNGSGKPGVVVGAPAGVNLTSFGGLLTGQVLGGQAYVYFGNGSGINAAIGARLQASGSALLGSAANLFGYKVKGLKTVAGAHNGAVLVSAPVGGTVTNALSLTVKTGNVSVFKQKTTTPTSPVTADQSLETPRSSSALQVLDSVGFNVLTGVSTDNMYDVNCDGFPDIVVGEPLSSTAAILALQTAPVGGNAYVYTGTSNGLFNATPFYTVSASYDPANFSSVNAVALLGYSVAGVRRIFGGTTAPRMVIGAPAGALDFGSGLLNLGNTLSTLFSFTAGNNGPGKAYEFDLGACAIALPIGLLSFNAEKLGNTALLRWKMPSEGAIQQYSVERSSDGNQWKSLGTVLGDANTSFSYTDVSPLQGMNFYRLQLQHTDGKTSLSQVANLNFSAVDEVRMYPIPVSDVLNIAFPSEGAYHIRIVDMYGRTIASLDVSGKTHRLLRQNMGIQASGLYRVDICGSHTTTSRTIVVD